MFLALRRDPPREGPLRPAGGGRRPADVPDPHPAGAAERPAHLVRGGHRAPVGAGAGLLGRRPAHAAGQRDHPALEAAIAGVPASRRRAGSARGRSTVAVGGGDQSDAALIGYEKPGLGAPTMLSSGRMPDAAGEAVGSAGDFALGDRVAVVGLRRGRPCRSSAWRRTPQIQVTPTLFVAWDDYVSATERPTPTRRTVLPSVVGARPADGLAPDDLAVRDQRRLRRGRRADAARPRPETPGVADVQRSVQRHLPALRPGRAAGDGLFFLIITLQKARALTLLRAIGAPAGVLVRSLLVQVVRSSSGAACCWATLLFAPLSQASPRLADAELRPRPPCCCGRAAARPRPGERGGGGAAGCSPSIRSRRRPGRRTMKLAPARTAPPARALRDRHGDPHPDRALLMFLGLLDGLTAGSTGALRAQRADLIVYSSDSPGLAGAQPHHPPRCAGGRGGRRRAAPWPASAACQLGRAASTDTAPRPRPGGAARLRARRRAGCPTRVPGRRQVYADRLAPGGGHRGGQRDPAGARTARR